jgi:hypothetical protein
MRPHPRLQALLRTIQIMNVADVKLPQELPGGGGAISRAWPNNCRVPTSPRNTSKSNRQLPPLFRLWLKLITASLSR